jgi:hypothetical protein
MILGISQLKFRYMWRGQLESQIYLRSFKKYGEGFSVLRLYLARESAIFDQILRFVTPDFEVRHSRFFEEIRLICSATLSFWRKAGRLNATQLSGRAAVHSAYARTSDVVETYDIPLARPSFDMQ